MYLACKIEESPHHIKTVISEMKKLTEDKGGFPYENHKVAEMEFYLMEELNFNMIVFHPYRTLKALADEILGDKNEGGVQMALFIVNDTYRTDMCLLYPPHVIAAAALYFSIAIKEGQYNDNGSVGESNGQGVVTRNSRKIANNESSNDENTKVKDIRQWFAELNVDFEQITCIVQELISLYELWDENLHEIQIILQKLKK
ncbi:16882_t:CDS:2 [Acaulospora colombiana]|uniref:16882_t:CDS:1 n=1 Tax=Acaulospora colombiana TaxID=27376 RepID=A0ACA9JXV4_9GLOM|nr:16882_t:CDS:2 [Acaulospora colombiana]